MDLLLLILTDLPTYGILAWLGFVALAYVAARNVGGVGVIVGHVVLAMCIAWIDVRWVEQAMDQPGWDGVPDLDGLFVIGVLMRVVLINTLLLPVSFLGLYVARKSSDAKPSALEPV